MVITVVAVLAAPLIMWVFAPGFKNDPEKFHLAANMLQITFPYLLLISLTAFAGGILNSYGAFALSSFTSVLLNLVMIASALFLAPFILIFPLWRWRGAY
jgi:putative peptidoglycan lipid II flippase